MPTGHCVLCAVAEWWPFPLATAPCTRPQGAATSQENTPSVESSASSRAKMEAGTRVLSSRSPTETRRGAGVGCPSELLVGVTHPHPTFGCAASRTEQVLVLF